MTDIDEPTTKLVPTRSGGDRHRDPRRTFSYPEKEWQAVQKVAAERRESVTEVIRRALRDYVATDNSAA